MLANVAPVAAFLVAAGVVYLLAHPRWGPRVLDHPNERSLHALPTPRTGGIGIVAGLLAGALVAATAGAGDAGLASGVLVPVSGGAGIGVLAPVLLCAGAVAAVSFVDDLRPISPLPRLAVQVGAALGLVVAGVYPGTVEVPGAVWAWPAWLAVGVSVLATVWMTNLYNFMDGMDGFAGGMTVAGFAALAVLGLIGGRADYALASAVVAAAAAGFLLFNFPPARIFMGDVGSSTLGFLAAAFALWGSREGLFPLWMAALVFSPFVVDATVTLLRRTLAGERVWQAHRTHYYQRLVRLGWTHRKAVLGEYALMAGCALSAAVAVRTGPVTQWALIAGWTAVYAVLALGVSRLERSGSLRSTAGP
jgi:UDP-N-acetylmuramyl pentapeptide phosphotransferase/UDP-N-acetylglucosamine-1-phosphate transferase